MDSATTSSFVSWVYPAGTRLVFNASYMDDGAIFPQGTVIYSGERLEDGSVKAFMGEDSRVPFVIPASHVPRILGYLEKA